ncbi:hypothetical protein RRG08_030235 [Elysia crispata]|uniref:Uncharacterized protein n=1 Tax=Elysia crispata TaxID=231223 RepID=A0AAE1DZB7_9GAST|nr:hypothetical protein RRG08_030235 [Elysia crispata]
MIPSSKQGLKTLIHPLFYIMAEFAARVKLSWPTTVLLTLMAPSRKPCISATACIPETDNLAGTDWFTGAVA